MSGLLERLGSAFVAPPPSSDLAAPAKPAEVRAVPASIAVLAPAGDAHVIGAAVALALAQRSRCGHAVLASWLTEPASKPFRAPAARRARKLATALASRGHAAAVRGRLTVVDLAGSCVEATAEATRVAAVAADVPCVVVLAGPRDESADALLTEQDRVVVGASHDGDRAVAELTAVAVASLGVPPHVLELPAAPPARALAAAGAALVPPLRAPVEAALGTLASMALEDRA